MGETAGGAHGPMSGTVAIVTGGTRGIGAAIARSLLEAGAQVVVCGRSEPGALPEGGGRTAHFIACDVRKADQCANLVARTVERFGALHLLVNNAGGSPNADAATASPRFSEAIVALNLLAPIHMSRAAHAALAENPEGGLIVNIASVSATRPSPGTAVYGASKAGLVSLTRSLAQEWAPSVRLNAIVVGLVETEDSEQTYGSQAAQQAIAAATPLGRMVQGNDVANAVLLLADPRASAITGAIVDVHCGGEKPHFLDLVARHAGKGD